MQGNVTSCFCLNTNKGNVIQLEHFQYWYNLLLQSCSQEIWLLPEIFKKEAQRLSFAPFLAALYRENCWQKIQLAIHAFHVTKFCWKLAHNPGNLLQKKNCNHLNLAAMKRRKQFWTGGFAVKVANLEVCGWCSSGKH